MHVHDYVWYATVGVMVAVLVVDVFVIGRRPHEPSTKESATAIVVYVSLALLFGLGVWYQAGAGTPASSLRAGWPSTA